MARKTISVYTNSTEKSIETYRELASKLDVRGYKVISDYSDDTDLIVCIGGDGAFLKAVHSFRFPSCPIIGINTGHLGFFQEISPDDLDVFIDDYENGEYSIQKLNTVQAVIKTDDGLEHKHEGLNEIVIKGKHSYSVHLFISIDGMPMEKFSGDGILVATSSGSTAYSYSLGGCIVDPRLKALQVTPIAPMNTIAYRSFTSSVLLPSDLSLGIVPEEARNMMFITNDGIETGYSNVSEIKVEASDTVVNLLRFKDYDFWNKVKTKFL